MRRPTTRAARNAFVFSFLVMGLALSGCALDTLGSDAKTVRTSAPTSGDSKSGSPTPPPAFSQFSDVPVPANARMDLEKTIILGAEDGWIGRLALTTGYPLTEMYSFYEREMPNFSWDRITVVRSSVTTMTYSRGNRIATITLQPSGSSSSIVDFTVSPYKHASK
jgi:hypothetical protein